jgi:hypothetical protein
MKTKSKMKAVVKEPLFSGESNPSMVNVRVATLMSMQISHTPVPSKMLRSIDKVARVRKTSP